MGFEASEEVGKNVIFTKRTSTLYMSVNSSRIYLIAGESSGDLHGKNLVAALQSLRPNIEFAGVGGDGMKARGVNLVRHIRDTNFMGFIEVLKNLGTIRRLFKEVKADILKFKPDVVILIDYPGFNLRMAKYLKTIGIKVIYYISPQVWAWKKNRVKKIKKYVDRMLVIFPFEKDFYKKEGYEVDFVGHPLLDELAKRNDVKEEIRNEWGIGNEKVVAILPGSRSQEISRMLPPMLAVRHQFPHCKFIIAGAPGQEKSFYHSLIQNGNVEVIANRTYELLSIADAAIVTSGTATMETALFRVPEVVCYAGPWLSVKLARLLIQVPYICIVNLVLDKPAIKELIQEEFTAANLSVELKAMLEDADYRQTFADNYELVREKLGGEGASQRAAERILQVIGN